MDDVSDSAVPSAVAPTSRPQGGGVKGAIALAGAVVLATSAGGAYAYSAHIARENAAAKQAAAAKLTAARTNLALAEESAVDLGNALTALGSAATGMADSGT